MRAQKQKGKSDGSANAICGQIEKNTKEALKQAGTSLKYEDSNNHLYIRTFLLDASVNINLWGVNPNSLDQKINTFIGKPLVLTASFHHPMPPEMDRVGGTDEYDNDDDPYNTLKVNDIVDHWLQYQEIYRIGSIIDIVKKADTYFAIIEVTDPAAKDAFRNNDLPLFVSPAIAQLDPKEDPTNITNWTGVHIAVVSEPAYTIKKALVTSQCHGEEDKCLLQLRQAAILKKEIPRLGCGFCRYDALERYASVVKPLQSNTQQHLVVINTKNPDDLTNSSIEFSKPNSSLIELTDNHQNNQSNNDNNNNKNLEEEQQNQKSDLKVTQNKTTNKETEEETTKETVTKEAEEIALKVAGMAECIQIFQQNGVQDPQQATQICKLAAQALLEKQPQQQQQPAGGQQQQGAPRGTGQFGSIDYEKELAKYEAKVAELTDQLKMYKKGDKTDAQRIAELEDQVTDITRRYKEKELEAYLVTKIADEELRNKKIKRFAELNLSIDDVKDIYPPNAVEAPKGNTGSGNIKKTAEVNQQDLGTSPISRVKLQVASTENNDKTDASTVNPVRERNNKIISSLLSKGGIY